MDSYVFLSLGDSGMLHSSEKLGFKRRFVTAGFGISISPVWFSEAFVEHLPGYQDHQVVFHINFVATHINIVS